MKILEKINLNSDSKTYIAGIIIACAAFFIITGVVFLAIIANKLDIIMTQPAKITYTYFVALMDRILVLLTIFVIIPLSYCQITSKNKSRQDFYVSGLTGAVFLIIIITFLSGEVYYLKNYKSGELSYSKMFCTPTIETKLFNKIIQKSGNSIPKMCLPQKQKTAGNN